MTYISLGYLIGTFIGVYINIQTLFLLIVFLLFSLISLLFSYNIKNKTKKKYNDIIKKIYKKYFFKILVLIIGIVLAILRVNSINKNIEKVYKYNEISRTQNPNNLYNLKIIEKNTKEYSNYYIAKLIDFNNIKVSFKAEDDLKLLKTYKIEGNLRRFNEEANYRGFNERKYYYSKKTYFNLDVNKNLNIIEANDTRLDITDYIIKLKEILYKSINKHIKRKDVFKALLFGDSSELDQNIKEKFKQVNLYHILAVSGLHIGYLVLILKTIFNKTKMKINNKLKLAIQIILLIVFMLLIDMSSSVTRAVLLVVINMGLKEFNIKYGFLNSVLLSIFLLLVLNPYTIFNNSFYLSYIAAISIYFFLKIEDNLKIFSKIINILKIDRNRDWKLRDRILRRQKYKEDKYQKNLLLQKQNKNQILKEDNKYILKTILSYIFYNIYISITVYLSLLPVLIYLYGELTLNFFIATLFSSLVISILCILGFIFIFLSIISKLFNPIVNILVNIIDGLIVILEKIVIYVAKFNEELKLIHYIRSPSLFFVISFYILLLILFYLFFQNINIFYSPNAFLKQIIIKFKRMRINKKILLTIILIVFIFSNLVFHYRYIFKKEFNISFLYVNQGDSSFIVTPSNKTILIDTGSGGDESIFDYGREIRRYILARGYNRIDYLFISHFDKDHMGGVFTILNSIKIGRIYIPKYVGRDLEKKIHEKYGKKDIKEIINIIKSKEKYKKGILEEDDINYALLLEGAKEKKVEIFELERGDSLKLDKYTSINVIFPIKELINVNSSNNNSVVFKLNGKIKDKTFSILYTGDIEKEAINKIIELNRNTVNKAFKLSSDVLKIPHHGSKNSLSSEFINLVNPKIAIISCGKNNIYKHPHKEVLKSLRDFNIKVLRTDVSGEIRF